MLSSMMFLTLGRIAAMMLITQLGLAPAGEAPRQEGEARQLQAGSTRTGKERLGGKASDEQRVDNNYRSICAVRHRVRTVAAMRQAQRRGAGSRPPQSSARSAAASQASPLYRRDVRAQGGCAKMDRELLWV